MDQAEDKNLDYQQGTVSAVDLHDAVRREDPLQKGGEGGAGLFVLIVSAAIVFFAGGHLFYSLAIPRYYHPDPRPSLGGAGAEAAKVAWIEEWMGEGKGVYNNCIACHQASGLGIPGQFPPLVGSEWVDGGTSRLGAILLHGINGPFKVGGQTYNQLMPAWNTLSDEKIAQVLTYVRRTFGTLSEGEDGVVTTEMIKAAREEFSAHEAPFAEAELLAIPGDAMLPGAKVNLETGNPL
ncbi:MAG TPA: cytochrome c [Bacteroidia bacterium]|nr:cytochrome c [Bacteroidia bacterium]